MTRITILAGVAAALLALPTAAHAACEEKKTGPSFFGHKHKYEDCDTDTDSTKNLNGRVGDAAVLSSTLDTRIGTGGDRLNLDLNWNTNEFGGPGAAGGGVFFHVPELADNLYLGVRGGHSFEGAGSIVGMGLTYSASPF